MNEIVVLKGYTNEILELKKYIHMDNIYKHVKDSCEFYIYLK
jgi:hypothetical protein